MGLKKRTITIEEEYFEMEVNDIDNAYFNFYRENQKTPSIIIIHPKHRDELQTDFWKKIHRYAIQTQSTPSNSIFYRGTKIIFSYDIKEEMIEIY